MSCFTHEYQRVVRVVRLKVLIYTTHNKFSNCTRRTAEKANVVAMLRRRQTLRPMTKFERSAENGITKSCVIYGSVYVHRVVASVGIISTLRLSICLVDLPHLYKLMSRCRVK